MQLKLSAIVLLVLAMVSSSDAALIMPAYNSLPGAPATFFIDFDGDFTATYSAPPNQPLYTPGTTLAYDMDSNPADFNAQELANIQEIWARVAEIYSPFNINVTTVDPGALVNQQSMKVVVGGDGAWLGQLAGGVSPFNVGAFTNSEPNLAFAFSQNLAGGDPKRVALATAHEAGHLLGLVHQSTYNVIFLRDEYNPGTPEKAPIMGVAYNSARGLWWHGQSRRGWNILQDDMAMISALGSTANNFGYRADDHPSTPLSAEALVVSPQFTVSVAGIIEQTSDGDYFSFTTAGGYSIFDAQVAQFGPTLDLSLRLLDSAGNVLATSAGSSLSEHIEYHLPAGSYVLGILSAGNYGDVGQYSLSGSLIPEPGVGLIGLFGLSLGLLRRGRHPF